MVCEPVLPLKNCWKYYWKGKIIQKDDSTNQTKTLNWAL